MRRISCTVAFAACLGLVISALDAEGGMKSLPGHFPPIVQQLAPIGDLPPTNTLHLAIGVQLRDPQGLDDFLAQLYNPASTNYQHYLTPQEFTERFGPAAADYATVIAFAASHNLTVTHQHANRLLLDVSGAVGDINSAFGVRLRLYHHPTESRDFYSPDTEPTVDDSLPIADISGLNNYSRPHPRLHVDKRAVPRSGSGGGGGYMGGDFRAAYVPGVSATGTGQIVGLLEFDGFYSNDIASYESQAHLPAIPVQTVLLDNYNGAPTTGSGSGNPEVSLDIEMAMSMAPGLASIVSFEGNPNDVVPNDVLNAMAASNQIKQLSCSWGWGGGPSTTTDNIFKQMESQGQSFFNASGDSDAFTVGATSANGVDNVKLANTPSSSPYITQVGATELTTTGPLGSYVSETVWNWGLDGKRYVGTSGGVSSYYSIPTWQAGVSMANNSGSTANRNIPDVALTGDNVYIEYGNGTNEIVGGTSCAAPLWAGFTALVNQQRLQNGETNLGFANPILYAIAESTNYAITFHDITTGNDTSSDSPNNYYAAAGYDLCSGWGTPNGPGLLAALAGPPPALNVSPTSGFSASGPAGGPFTPTSETVLLSNASSSTLSWTTSSSAGWIAAAPSSGNLPPGGTVSVNVSLTASAAALTVGGYEGTVTVTDLSSTGGATLNCQLTVGAPLAVSPTSGFTSSGPVGGPYSISNQVLIVTNSSAASFSWSALSSVNWLSVSPPNGTIPGGTSTSINVSLAPAATPVFPASYLGTITITNLSGDGQTSLNYQLTLSNPITVSPISGFTTAGNVGGPFSISNQSVTISNASVTSFSWAASTGSNWLTATPSSGTIGGQSAMTIDVALTPQAYSLGVGSFTNHLIVSNSSGAVTTLTYTLTAANPFASIVQNGGFETGSFADWTLVGDKGNYNEIASTSFEHGEFVHSGKYGAALGDTSIATLSQTLSTVPGQNYLLSFWFDNPSSGSGQIFALSWNSNQLYGITNPPAFSWTNLQYLVSAPGTSSVLQFAAENQPSYFGLDDISVTPVPAARFQTAVATPSSGLSLSWPAAPGVSYQVQYTTSLVQPVWMNLGSPVIATGTSLTVSDTSITPATTQRFYRLVVQP